MTTASLRGLSSSAALRMRSSSTARAMAPPSGSGASPGLPKRQLSRELLHPAPAAALPGSGSSPRHTAKWCAGIQARAAREKVFPALMESRGGHSALRAESVPPEACSSASAASCLSRASELLLEEGGEEEEEGEEEEGAERPALCTAEDRRSRALPSQALRRARSRVSWRAAPKPALAKCCAGSRGAEAGAGSRAALAGTARAPELLPACSAELPGAGAWSAAQLPCRLRAAAGAE